MFCCLWSCFVQQDHKLDTLIAALIAALGHWGAAEFQAHNSKKN